MININLDITAAGINAEAEEKLRLHLRNALLGFILAECDRAFVRHHIALKHTDVVVDGNIVIKDPT